MATTSASRWPPLVRSLVDTVVATPNMRLASTAPATAPTSCATAYPPTSPNESPWPVRRPRNQSASETTGFRCAPDTGPNNRISTVNPRKVAVLFSSSCRPTSFGDSCSAVMPEPTTTATSRPLPMNSASSLLPSGGRSVSGMPAS